VCPKLEAKAELRAACEEDAMDGSLTWEDIEDVMVSVLPVHLTVLVCTFVKRKQAPTVRAAGRMGCPSVC
jgi:hypothetical protein